MAKKRTASKTRMPMDPRPMLERMQSSGMMKAGDMMMKPPAVIAARMQKPTGRKSKKGRSK